MPYITHDKRPGIEKAISQAADEIKALPDDDLDGAFNYAVTRLIVKLFGKVGYSNFVRVSGGLNEVKDEYRRQVVSKYEDMKKDQNGDVYGIEM